MKILLVRAGRFSSLKPRGEEYGEPLFWEPLPLEVIGAAVSDHDVELLDMELERDLEKTLDSFQPDMVGVTSHSVPQVIAARDTLERVRNHNPKIFTVVGGFGATTLSEEFNREYVDAVVIGEGEDTFRELVQAVEEGDDYRSIEGIAYSDNGKLIHTKPRSIMNDFENSPLPDRSLCKKYYRKYTHFLYGTPMQLITSSKGCDFRCKFCCVWKRLNRVILKSPERVVKELESAEAPNIGITDDNFFHDYARAEKIAKMVKERGIKKNDYFFFASVELIARYPRLTEMWRELSENMFMFVGMEAINNETLKKFGKYSSWKQNEEALRILKENNIPFLCSFICDTTFEKEDFERLANFVVDKEIPFPIFLVLTPMPGSVLYEERGHELLTRDWSQFDCYNLIVPTKMPQKEFLECYDSLWQISREHTIKYATSQMEVKDLHLDLFETFIDGYRRDRDTTVRLTD